MKASVLFFAFFVSAFFFGIWVASGEETTTTRKKKKTKKEKKPSAGPEAGQPRDVSKLGPDEMGNIMFEILDANKDGIMTQEEVDEFNKNMPADKLAAGAMPPDKMFKVMDKDLDGKVTREEANYVFKHLTDAMAMGKLKTAEELIKSDAGGDTKSGAIKGASEGSASRPKGESAGQMFDLLDVDRDGLLTSKEIEAFAKVALPQESSPDVPGKFLSLLDENGDGKVTREESAELFSSIDAHYNKHGLPEAKGKDAPDVDRIQREFKKEAGGFDLEQLQDLLSDAGGREELARQLQEMSRGAGRTARSSEL